MGGLNDRFAIGERAAPSPYASLLVWGWADIRSKMCIEDVCTHRHTAARTLVPISNGRGRERAAEWGGGAAGVEL